MDVGAWLRALGLGAYTKAFEDNAVDAAILQQLDDADLRELGVAALGHRKKLLAAIAALAAEPAVRPVLDGDRQAGERRQITVLFCDIVGSAEIAAAMDPEEFRDLIGHFQERCVDAIVRYEGTVAKFLGDGALAFFGLPVAHEDDAERAVRAGLHLVEAVTAFSPLRQRRIELRVAVATGLVVTGDTAGAGALGDIVGDVPNLAARLQHEAPPGSVVIAPATRRLIGNVFEYEDLGVRTLKGMPQPVAVTRVLRERPSDSRFAAVHAADLSPFVGRDQEVGLLLDRWRLACDGEGQVVVLTGEAGIGKSRITETLHERLVDEPHIRVRYQCSPHHVNSALFPAMTQLALASGIEADDSPTARLDKLARLIQQTDPSHADVVPFLAEMMGIACDGVAAPADVTPQQKKARILQALAGQLFGLAAHQPVLLVLEDAHWIDPTTRELFDLVIDPIHRARVLCLVTARPEFGTPWIEHAHTTALRMNRLGQRQCVELVSRISAHRPLPQAIMQEIVARADGVPLFVEELTRSVLEQPASADPADQPQTVVPLAVPSSLHDSLMGRLDRMSTAKDVAQMAAVIGREFSRSLLAAICDLAPGALDDALGRLEDAGLIFRRGTAADPTYTFKHALIQDMAHGSLLRSRRHRLHGRVAETLESGTPGVTADDEPEIIAHHFSEAARPDRAAPFWLQAGRIASERSAFQEAIAHLRRGIAAAAEMPPGADRIDLQIDLQMALATASIAAQGYAAAETEHAYFEAHRLLEGRRDDLRQIATIYGLFVTRWNLARLTESVGFAQELLSRDRGPNAAVALCVGHRSLAVAYNPMGRFSAARDHATTALTHYDPAKHAGLAAQFGQDIGVAACAHVMLAERFLGAEDAAASAEDRTLELARSVGHANTIGYALMWAAFGRVITRHLEDARRLSDELMAFAAERQMGFWAILARLFLTAIRAPSDPPAAIRELQEVRGAFEKLRSAAIWEPLIACVEAETLASMGRAAETLACIDRSLATAQASAEHWLDSEFHRLKARGLLMLKGTRAEPEAERALRAAIAIADGQGARPMRLRAALDLAVLRAESGARDEARAILSAACEPSDEAKTAPEFVQARALLKNLG